MIYSISDVQQFETFRISFDAQNKSNIYFI